MPFVYNSSFFQIIEKVFSSQHLQDDSKQVFFNLNIMLIFYHQREALMTIFCFGIIFFVKQIMIFYVFQNSTPIRLYTAKIHFEIKMGNTKIVSYSGTALGLIKNPTHTFTVGYRRELIFLQKQFLKSLMMLYNDNFSQDSLESFKFNQIK